MIWVCYQSTYTTKLGVDLHAGTDLSAVCIPTFNQAQYLPESFDPIFSGAERAELIALLKQLGDSPALRFRILASSWGFAPFLEWQHTTKLQLKGILKGWLSKLKRASSIKIAEPTPASQH